jgi:hypothetical protein
MRYIISEQQFDSLVLKYLDTQNFRGKTKYFDHEKISLDLYTSSETQPDLMYFFNTNSLKIGIHFLSEIKSMFPIEREKLIELIVNWFEENSRYKVRETQLGLYL